VIAGNGAPGLPWWILLAKLNEESMGDQLVVAPLVFGHRSGLGRARLRRRHTVKFDLSLPTTTGCKKELNRSRGSPGSYEDGQRDREWSKMSAW
jgi:hypothetical protein